MNHRSVILDQLRAFQNSFDNPIKSWSKGGIVEKVSNFVAYFRVFRNMQATSRHAGDGMSFYNFRLDQFVPSGLTAGVSLGPRFAAYQRNIRLNEILSRIDTSETGHESA
jgi:hypothetical protein